MVRSRPRTMTERGWRNGVEDASLERGKSGRRAHSACRTASARRSRFVRSRTGLGPIGERAVRRRYRPERNGPVVALGPGGALCLRRRAICSRSRMCRARIQNNRLPPNIRALTPSPTPFRFSPSPINPGQCRSSAASFKPPRSARDSLNCLFRSATSTSYRSPHISYLSSP